MLAISNATNNTQYPTRRMGAACSQAQRPSGSGSAGGRSVRNQLARVPNHTRTPTSTNHQDDRPNRYKAMSDT